MLVPCDLSLCFHFVKLGVPKTFLTLSRHGNVVLLSVVIDWLDFFFFLIGLWVPRARRSYVLEGSKGSRNRSHSMNILFFWVWVWH